MLRVVLDLLQQYGFGAAMAGFVAFILYYVLKFVRENVHKIMDQAKEREEAQRAIIKDQHKAVSDLAQEVKSVRRAHTRDHAKMSQSLTEVTKALGRINGYKK